MAISEKIDDKYIKDTENLYAHHLQKAKEHKEQAEVFLKVLELIKPKQEIKEEKKLPIAVKRRKGRNGSFEDDAVEFVAMDETPKDNSDFVEWQQKKTKKPVVPSNMSSRLISLTKSKGTIKAIKLSPSLKIWGLPNWFEANGEMKKEYMDRYKK